MKHKSIYLIILFSTIVLKVYSQVSPTVRIIPLGDNQCITYNPHGNYLFDNSPVIKTCKGNTVTYEAVGQNLTSYTWTVTGGTSQLSQNNQQCTVTWGNDDHGSIEVTCTTSSEETCADRLNVYIEDKPTCRSISTPAYYINPNNPSEKIIHVCFGDSLIFTDNSVSPSSPIVSYYWASPWGTSANRTYSFSAQSIGSDFELVHRIYNECGCYDEETISIIVDEACPLELSCYGTVCAHSSADYFVNSPTCSSYHWDVDGGTIIDGQNTQHIKVLWGAPETGYGTISLDATPCQCSCKAIKSVRIPVISENVPIKGPDIICNNSIESFSLPLWGGTGYHWTVSPENNASIIQADSTNEILLRTSQTGTYTITATYKCDFIHCGPYTATKTITVKDNLEITSPQTDIVCKGEDATFTTNSTTASSWSIFKNNIPVHQPSSPSVELIYAFSDEGFYTIKATNTDFCNTAEMTIEVAPIPPQPTNINGPHEICPNSSEYYTAEALSSDYYILWEWHNGGTDPVTCTGERVMITFGSEASDINVYQVDKRTGCHSEAAVLHTYLFNFGTWPYSSPIKMCEGQTKNLNQLTLHPDVPVLYKWTIDPTQALTVVGDHLQPHITLMANYCDPEVNTATLRLDWTACKVDHVNIATVILGEIDPPAIQNGVYCRSISSELTLADEEDLLNADKQQSSWEVEGVGTFLGIPGHVVFPTTGVYNITLNYVSRFGCTVTSSTQVNVGTFPTVDMAFADGQICVTAHTFQPVTYTWSSSVRSQNCVPIPTDGPISCTVCLENGCCTTLNYSPPPQPCINASGIENVRTRCYNIVDVTLNPNVMLPATLTFYRGNIALINTVQLDDYTCTLLLPSPGITKMHLEWSDINGDYCEDYPYTPTPSSDWLNFSITGDCYGNIIIHDNSSYVSTPPVRDVTVTYPGGTPIATQFTTDPTLVIPAYASSTTEIPFQIHIQFDNSTTCALDYNRTLGPIPMIRGLSIPSTMCANTPAIFTADAIGSGLEYKWNFGDDSYNYGNNIYHTYGTTPHDCFLQVTDDHGCIKNRVFSVTVVGNNIVRRLSNSDPIANCPSDPLGLLYTDDHFPQQYLIPSNQFHWTPQVTFPTPSPQTYQQRFNVYQGGDFRVLEVDPNTGCKGEATLNVKYPNEIPTFIVCKDTYCQGEQALAIGNAGPQYQYQWELHDQSDAIIGSSTDANYRFTVPTGTTCTLFLTVREGNCTDPEAPISKTININSLPPAPVIQYNGNPCITEGPVELNAAVNPSYRLLWSNGNIGFTTQYLTDGPASAYYIDNNGCHSPLGVINIPKAPDFDGVLTGCYPICMESTDAATAVYQLGCDVGVDWEWQLEGNTIKNGTVPSPPASIRLPLPSSGNYNLFVEDYGEGCTARSPTLQLTPVDCVSGSGGFIPSDHRIDCSKILLECTPNGCEVEYSGSVYLCNLSQSTINLSNIGSNPLLPTTWSPSTPIPIAAGNCITLNFSFTYDFTTPTAVQFTLFDDLGAPVGSFAVELLDAYDCLSPGDCDLSMPISVTPYPNLIHPGDMAYFSLSCAPVAGITIMKVWCDGPGEVVSGTGGTSYSGTWMIDLNRLSQMAFDGEEICFYVLYCIDGEKPCVTKTCYNAYNLYDECDVSPRGMSNDKKGGSELSEGMANAGTRYRLHPNPATGKVCVVDATTGDKAAEVESVTVLSLLGQTMQHYPYGQVMLDVSSLPQGSYMVKVNGTDGTVEHLKLVKIH